jgi:hypothetical protein
LLTIGPQAAAPSKITPAAIHNMLFFSIQLCLDLDHAVTADRTLAFI